MSKRLKDLPGFDDAMALVLKYHGGSTFASFDEVGDIVLPGFRRVTSWSLLWNLAIMIGVEKYELSKRPLKLVPLPRPIAANDCEAAE